MKSIKSTLTLSQWLWYRQGLEESLREDAPLDGQDGDEHRQANRAHAVAGEARHEVGETNQHHDQDAREHLVHVGKGRVLLQKGFLGQRAKQYDHQQLHHG
jgi:hypothetical protein